MTASIPRVEQDFVEEIARRYRLTHQELRQLNEAALDLTMWEEGSAGWGGGGKGEERSGAIMAKRMGIPDVDVRVFVMSH